MLKFGNPWVSDWKCQMLPQVSVLTKMSLQAAHWQFCVEYFSAVLQLYYSFNWNPNDSSMSEPASSDKTRRRIVTLILVGSYIVFYGIQAWYWIAWSFFSEASASYVNYLSVIVGCLPLVILIPSIELLRSKVRDTPGFYANEKLMTIHAGLGAGFLTLTIIQAVLTTMESSSDQKAVYNWLDLTIRIL